MKNFKNPIIKLNKLRNNIRNLDYSSQEQKNIINTLSIVYDAIDSTIGGVIITDLVGKIVYVNSSFIKMFGYNNKNEVLDKNAVDLFASNEVKKFSDVSVMIDITKNENEEFCVYHSDGKKFFVEVSSHW